LLLHREPAPSRPAVFWSRLGRTIQNEPLKQPPRRSVLVTNL
jgi:hypothetical protein